MFFPDHEPNTCPSLEDIDKSLQGDYSFMENLDVEDDEKPEKWTGFKIAFKQKCATHCDLCNNHIEDDAWIYLVDFLFSEVLLNQNMEIKS